MEKKSPWGDVLVYGEMEGNVTQFNYVAQSGTHLTRMNYFFMGFFHFTVLPQLTSANWNLQSKPTSTERQVYHAEDLWHGKLVIQQLPNLLCQQPWPSKHSPHLFDLCLSISTKPIECQFPLPSTRKSHTRVKWQLLFWKVLRLLIIETRCRSSIQWPLKWFCLFMTIKVSSSIFMSFFC